VPMTSAQPLTVLHAQHRCTPLTLAAQYGTAECIRELLNAGAELEAVDNVRLVRRLPCSNLQCLHACTRRMEIHRLYVPPAAAKQSACES